jgi:2'-5' RNA ligase
MIRSFIAIELLDEDTINSIVEFANQLKKNQGKIKLVEPQNLHMTLKFLGNIVDELAPKIFSTLQEKVNDTFFSGGALLYRLKGAGQFKNHSVIWIKLQGNVSVLQDIKNLLEEELYEQFRVPKDKRSEFEPHLTIGRLKKEKIDYKNFDRLKQLIHESRDYDFGSFTVNKVKLKKSVLTPSGPIYSDLEY